MLDIKVDTIQTSLNVIIEKLREVSDWIKVLPENYNPKHELAAANWNKKQNPKLCESQYENLGVYSMSSRGSILYTSILGEHSHDTTNAHKRPWGRESNNGDGSGNRRFIHKNILLIVTRGLFSSEHAT